MLLRREYVCRLIVQVMVDEEPDYEAIAMRAVWQAEQDMNTAPMSRVDKYPVGARLHVIRCLKDGELALDL